MAEPGFMGRSAGAELLAQRRIVAAAAAAAALMVAVQAFVIYPLFRQRLVDDTVEQVVRDGGHIRRQLQGLRFEAGAPATAAFGSAVEDLRKDFGLHKLRFFDPSGRITLSTDPAEVGQVNSHDYFHQRVARGEVVAHAVWRSRSTMEAQAAPLDLVETYLPLTEGGVFRGAFEIYSDITSRRRAMDRLYWRSLALTAAGALVLVGVAALLARRAARLQQQLIVADRLAALGTLVSGIAHEFNNVNVSVLGYSQLALERADLPPQVRDGLERIARAARRARSITTSLIHFSEPAGAGLVAAPLSEPLRAAVELVQAPYEKEGVRFDLRIRDLPDSHLSRERMVQVFLNLLTNARHALAGREEPLIRVETAAEGRWAVARVNDNGCGIAAEQVGQVFTPFFSTKGEHAAGGGQSQVKGAGLGLSVSHSIVRHHGGEIAVESRPGSGTTITVRLPVRAAEKG